MVRATPLVLIVMLAAGCSQPEKKERERPRDRKPAPAPMDLSLPAVLSGFSSLARTIDTGRGSLSELPEGMIGPSCLMSNLRRLFQRDPETGSRLLIYLHSPDEPIAARVVAVLSLSHLWTDSAVEFLGGLLKNPPDVKVAGAVAWGYHLCSFRDEPSWGDVLEHLVPMGLSKSYGFSNHMISGYCTKA